MEKLALILILLGSSGCAFGPLEITHEDGQMPKGGFNLPYDVEGKIWDRHSGGFEYELEFH